MVNKSFNHAMIAVLVALCFVAISPNAENLRRELAPNTLTMGWAGEGFLGIYHLGVLSKLVDLGKITRDSLMAGSSSGAILTGSYCAGVEIDTMKQNVFNQVEYCKLQNKLYCGGELDTFNRAALEASIPHGIGNLKKCQTTAFIHLTLTNMPPQPFYNCSGDSVFYWLTNPFGVSVASYEDRDQLIDAMASSSFIPGPSGFQCSTVYNFSPTSSAYVVDGAYSSIVPCPPGASSCVKVSAKPKGCWPNCGNATQYFSADIYPGIRKDANGNPILPGSLTMELYETGKLAFWFSVLSAQKEALFEAGRLDAEYYVNTILAG